MLPGRPHRDPGRPVVIKNGGEQPAAEDEKSTGVVFIEHPERTPRGDETDQPVETHSAPPFPLTSRRP